MAEKDAKRTWVMVNRAPVLTLWAAVVAEDLAFEHYEVLTLGRAVAGLTPTPTGFPRILSSRPQGRSKDSAGRCAKKKE